MELVVIDIGNLKQNLNIPDSPNTLLLTTLKEIPRAYEKSFTKTQDLNEALSGGKFYISGLTSKETGFIVAMVSQRPNVTAYCSISNEVKSHFEGLQEIRSLRELVTNQPSHPVSLSEKAVMIYRDTFDKFVNIYANRPLQRVKTKQGCINQIANLVGLKESQAVRDLIATRIFEDLKGHGIVKEGQVLKHNQDKIQDYFIDNTLEFFPSFNSLKKGFLKLSKTEISQEPSYDPLETEDPWTQIIVNKSSSDWEMEEPEVPPKTTESSLSSEKTEKPEKPKQPKQPEKPKQPERTEKPPERPKKPKNYYEHILKLLDEEKILQIGIVLNWVVQRVMHSLSQLKSIGINLSISNSVRGKLIAAIWNIIGEKQLPSKVSKEDVEQVILNNTI